VRVDRAVGREHARIHALAVDHQRLGIERGDRALEVQAAGDRHGPGAIARPPRNGRELVEPVAIGPRRDTHEQRPARPRHVAAVERCRIADERKRPVRGKCSRGGGHLVTPCRGARAGDDNDLVENDCRVFHEHAVGRVGQRRHEGDLHANTPKGLAVGRMLRFGEGEVDGLPRKK
jgi:hypothetical protein